MPSSASETIPYQIEFIRKNRPNLHTVLDIGIGFGKGGFLLREYFDVKRDQHFRPEDWQLQITGVEIFSDYLSSLQKMLYTEIIVGDIFEVLPQLGKFDLAILSDTLEHFLKEKGLELLDNLFDHVEDIVIATPYGFLPHPAKGINPHEEHKSGWTLENFKKYRVIDQAVVDRIRKPEKVLVIYLRKHKEEV